MRFPSAKRGSRHLTQKFATNAKKLIENKLAPVLENKTQTGVFYLISSFIS
jgi:hypothetical protein